MGLFAGTKFDRPPRCEHCEEHEEECTCPPPEPERVPPQRQMARLSKERRKRGKVVSTVTGLCATETDLAALLTRLKTLCGAGGTLKDGALEIQGDHVERIRTELKSIGYRIRG